MIVIGLTGSIAMGKTTIAKQFARCGAAVLDSDAVVHKLLDENGAAVAEVGRLFPAARKGNAIDRRVLGQEVFGRPEKLRKLEATLHPLVRKAQDDFIRKAAAHKKDIVVLDIPLLFETEGEKRCDYTVLVLSPAFLQKQRALARPHMTEEKLKHILARQMRNSEKIKRADFVVFTGIGKYNSLKMVKRIINLVKGNKNGAH